MAMVIYRVYLPLVVHQLSIRLGAHATRYRTGQLGRRPLWGEFGDNSPLCKIMIEFDQIEVWHQRRLSWEKWYLLHWVNI
jgi:hypothetical protein